MNKQDILGSWNDVKYRLKQTYEDLTDDDLLLIEGKEEDLLGKLQQKLGKTKGEVRDVIEKLASRAVLSKKYNIH